MKEIWRIAMASEIPWYSSEIVGKKRKITDMGITIFSETCIRSMAATNSPPKVRVEVTARRKSFVFA